ncbi:Regulator of chromosome condensation (RCC1) repeat-containing protein [Stigmatella erecta]|uniref:Regulator of chromosome condensation (RCC1) repeat-containing protein n=1 Tax=Stigmatella erecta TaxID=83460 RepID=A0A1I0B534_9BACT|nr:Regulator of chromosome condensation (RCC1) repeat-containing protein [Stigmatella erecta]
MAAGGDSSLALRADGTVWTWGTNGLSQLGDGSQEARPTPRQVPGVKNATALAAGWNHVLVQLQDGTLWGWGNNADGQVGDGSAPIHPSPFVVPLP